MYDTNFYNTNEINEIIKKLRRLIAHIEEEEDAEYENLLRQVREIYNDIIKKRDEIKLLLRTTDNNLNEEILKKMEKMKKLCAKIDEIVKKISPSIESITKISSRIEKKCNKLVILLGGAIENDDTSNSISNKLKRGVKEVKDQVTDIFDRKKKKLDGHTKNLKKANDTNTSNMLKAFDNMEKEILKIEVHMDGERLCGYTANFTVVEKK